MTTGQTTSTSSGISQRTVLLAGATMLVHAEPVLVLEKLGVSKPMPKNKGLTVKYRRPIAFTVATAPMVEGVTPPASRFSYEDVEVTLTEHGDWSEITDVIADTHEDPVLQDATMMHGENIGATKEQLIYGVVKAGTNVHYNNGTARTDVNTAITLNKVRAVVRDLKAQKAKPISRVLSASTKIGTEPVESAYVAVTHTNVEADIRNLAGFIPVAEYGSGKALCPQEIGRVENVRFILSPDLDAWADGGGAHNGMITTTGTSADVYPILYFGQDAFGNVPLKGKEAVTPVIKPIGSGGTTDPLDQRGTVGWKTYFAAVILNQSWMARHEVGATLL